MHWMDMLRGIAVLLVVFLHGADIPYLTGNGVEAWADVNRHLEPFRMPMLMFLSGMLLPRSLTKPVLLYLWGKFAAIGWPLILWVAIFGGLIYNAGIMNPGFWLSGGDYLWFLTALLICYVIGTVLKPLSGSHWWMLAAGVGLFLGMIATRHITDLGLAIADRTLSNGAFFFLGAGLAVLIPRWVKTPWFLILPMAALAAYCAHLGVDDRSLRAGTPQAAAISVLGIAVIIWAAARIPSGRLQTFLAWVGRGSIVVYIVHFPAAVLTRRVVVALDGGPVMNTVLCTVVAMTVALTAVALRPKMPWLYVFPRHQEVAARITAQRQPVAPANSPPAPGH